MLLKKESDKYINMAVSRYPEMTQFFQEIDNYGSENAVLTIKYRASEDVVKSEKGIQMPLTPGTKNMEVFNVDMHGSPTPAFKMPEKYSTWFSECFGYEVVLVYLGDNKRAVLFGDMQPVKPDSRTTFLPKSLSFANRLSGKTSSLHQTEPWKITFADCAPYLITSQTSLDDVSSRLPTGEAMDMTKFRPNIVISGAPEAYQEDYWGRLKINNQAEVILAHNCVRCKSINIDYATGKPGTGASGEVLKRLQKDRRIDTGSKWSPVFGRYSFWDPKWSSQMVRVGDRVNVTKTNDGPTVWSKFDRSLEISVPEVKCLLLPRLARPLGSLVRMLPLRS